jgi:hypothetical protein
MASTFFLLRALQFITEKGIYVPYSAGLVPAVFWMFLKLESG